MLRSLLFCRLALVSAAFGAAQAWAGAYPIAGVTPYERPAGAPVIGTVAKSPGWYEQALFGVLQPYPDSLTFLESQGNWYTPFNRPGMLGRYDIRGWHATEPAQ